MSSDAPITGAGDTAATAAAPDEPDFDLDHFFTIGKYFVLASFLVGCPGGTGEDERCVAPEDEHPAGEVHATVDGDSWVGNDANGYQLGATGLLFQAAGDGACCSFSM